MLDSNSRRMITETLRDKVGRHRQFSDTDWVLPENILTQLEAAMRRFEPEDVVTRHAWLFDEIRSVQERAGGKAEAEIATLRRAALQEVQGQRGWDGVLALAEAARASDEVGALFAESASANDDLKALPGLLRSSSEKITSFLRGYVWRRFQLSGWDWIKGMDTTTWYPREIAEVSLALPPFGQPTWDFVASKGQSVEEYYWRNATRRSLASDTRDIGNVVSMLLKYHRPFHACRVLRIAHNKCPVEPSLIMDALEAGLNDTLGDWKQAVTGDSPYFIVELLEELQKGVGRGDTRYDVTRVANLEWGYLGLLDGHSASPDTLHSILGTNPDFFVKLLGLFVRPELGPDEARTEPSEEEKARAQNAYRLLGSWKSVPGSREDKTVDEDALFKWIHEARSMAEQQACLEECDHRFGNVFAHAPFEQDGSWPCIPVRDAIEEIASEEVASGFELGIYNKRSAYHKSLEEGGNQERDLEKRYRDWAEACKIEWPRTAASLRQVADVYAAQAQREDAARALRW